MRAAAPIMSGFIIYLITLGGTVIAFRSFRKKLASAKYLAAASFLIVAFIMISLSNAASKKEVSASVMMPENHLTANAPIGVASGLKPGRVVWIWDEDATDKNLVPANNKANWWANFTNKEVVNEMLKKSILQYTDLTTIPLAWDALFKYFNEQHGKGSVGYKPGEKIYIKINLTNAGSVSGTTKVRDFERMDATPEVLLALLKQLIEQVGVAQSDIYLGDPFRTFHNLYWDMLQTAYPDVVYCDGKGSNGRHQTVPTEDPIMIFSDKKLEYRIPQEYVDSEYLINVPCLKTHDTGGITLGAKNHQGSVLQGGVSSSGQSAMGLHPYLPQNSSGYGKYRHLVDYLGHEQLGGKTLITIIDGIWAGRSWEGYVEKWNMAPFNGDYPSSIFVSQDRVAIDAVGYDFLLEEYKNKENKAQYAYMSGTDDYLIQAADPTQWAPGIEYDPEGDGTPIESLGVYEHWNNATEKKYSRNLGTGNGIELVSLKMSDINSVVDLNDSSNPIAAKIFPNPAKDNVKILYHLAKPCRVTAEIFNSAGEKVTTLFDKHEIGGDYNHPWNVQNLSPGNYILQINMNSTQGNSVSTVRFNVKK